MATEYTDVELLEMTPEEYRSIVRSGEWTGHSLYKCRGYGSTDMVILPKEYAYDFLVCCHRNPRTCPVVDITEPGSPHPMRVAPDADLRTDLPRYRVYKDGQVVDEPTDIKKYWRDDLVGFLLGCSAGFDQALKDANVHYRPIGVWATNIPCVPAGPFHGNLWVSCRLYETAHDAVRAIQITSRHLLFHGPPVHIGDPTVIGIKDLTKPDMVTRGEISPPQPSEIPLFWANGATNRAMAVNARLPLMIVDYPVCMFMTDKLSEELAIL